MSDAQQFIKNKEAADLAVQNYSFLRPTFLIIGPGGAGKDHAAQILVKYGQLTRAQSSSQHCQDYVWQRYQADFPVESQRYATVHDFWLNRSALRIYWMEKMMEYNTPDPARLAKEILVENQIYTGLRTLLEYNACMKANLFSLVIWIDSELAAPDPSLQLRSDHADVTIRNYDSCADARAGDKTFELRLFRLLLTCRLLKPEYALQCIPST